MIAIVEKSLKNCIGWCFLNTTRMGFGSGYDHVVILVHFASLTIFVTYFAILYCIILYDTVLYYIILYYVILRYMISYFMMLARGPLTELPSRGPRHRARQRSTILR